uniref:Putative secreted protein n=1 Tax=Anopheles triannulatus TaxID=58253 RepID=A0A2M4B6N1_9DIPT
MNFWVLALILVFNLGPGTRSTARVYQNFRLKPKGQIMRIIPSERAVGAMVRLDYFCEKNITALSRHFYY